jgi:HlyD family secretion protein
MTATATIQTSDRQPALLVPNTALRFTPAAGDGAASAPAAGGGGSIVSKLMPRPPGSVARRSGTAGAGGANGGSRQLWVLRDGQATAVRVTVGASDGRRTEVSGPGLTEGDLVIVDQRSGAAK